jgi:hypothetical protein
VLLVDAVMPRGLWKDSSWLAEGGREGRGWSSGEGPMAGGFFCPPKEKVRPARSKKPREDGLGALGPAMSPLGYLAEDFHSS